MHVLRSDNACPPTSIRRRCMKRKRIAALIMALILLCGSASAALSPLLPWITAYNQYAETLYVPTLSMEMLYEKDEQAGYYSFRLSEETFVDVYYSKDNVLEGIEVFVPVENVRSKNIFTACILAADSTLKREDIAPLFDNPNLFYYKDDAGEYCYQMLGKWAILFSKYIETQDSEAFVVYSVITAEAFDDFFDFDDEETEDGRKEEPEKKETPKDEPEEKDDGDKEQPEATPAPTPVPDTKIHKL